MTETIASALSVEALTSRAHWYRLLAGVFAEEPQRAFLRQLRSEGCLAELAELGVAFDTDFLDTDETTLYEALATEYTMLFVAPGGFPPMESVRLQGGYRQAASRSTRDAYASEGFVMHPQRFMTFDDHLALQMQFVATLLERQANARAEADEPEALRLEKAIKRFWVQHLGRWSRGFAQLVQRAAHHSFYREMGGLLAAFADAELALMGLRVADDDGARLRAPKPESTRQPMSCGGAAQ